MVRATAVFCILDLQNRLAEFHIGDQTPTDQAGVIICLTTREMTRQIKFGKGVKLRPKVQG